MTHQRAAAGGEQGEFGMAEKLGGRCRAVHCRNPDRYRQMFAFALAGYEAQGLHVLPQPLGNRFGRILRDAGKQEREFIAADAGHEIVLLDRPAEERGEPSKRLVTSGGAVFAVNFAEAIDAE